MFDDNDNLTEPIYLKTERGWFYACFTILGSPIWCGLDMKGNGFNTEQEAITAARQMMAGDE